MSKQRASAYWTGGQKTCQHMKCTITNMMYYTYDIRAGIPAASPSIAGVRAGSTEYDDSITTVRTAYSERYRVSSDSISVQPGGGMMESLFATAYLVSVMTSFFERRSQSTVCTNAMTSETHKDTAWHAIRTVITCHIRRVLDINSTECVVVVSREHGGYKGTHHLLVQIQPSPR